MAVLALVGFWGLLAVVFGVRTVLHRRLTGQSGWLAPQTPAARLGDGLFTVGLVATSAALVGDLAGVVHRLEPLDRPAVAVAGALLWAVGAVLAVAAQSQMGSAWRAGIDLAGADDLVTTGAFGVVRNPFYVGVMAASAGVALMVPNAPAVVGWVGLVVGCEIDVRLVEEPHLRASHGAAWERYARSTPRFVPGVPDFT